MIGICVFLNRKTVFVLFFLGFLGACSGYEIYNPDKYNRNSAFYFKDPSLIPQFVICSEIFAKRVDIDYEANIKCSTIKKQAQEIGVTVFTSCYMLRPIINEYKCV